jgi:hypothetical protein
MRIEITGAPRGNSMHAQLVVEWTIREQRPEIVDAVRDALNNETTLEIPHLPGLTWRVRSIAHENGREVKAIVAQLYVWTVKS